LGITQQIDTELLRENLTRLPDLGPETRSTGLVLDEVKAVGPDPLARSTALRAAVQKLVASEPPRKTVTGHFRAE
jgi:hypothetical protein